MALSQARFINEEKLSIRKYFAYPAPGKKGSKQLLLWAPMEEITRENMNESKTLRRNGMSARFEQLVNDVDHFNKHHNPGEPLLVDPDFAHDIQEKRQSAEYRDAPADEDLFDGIEPGGELPRKPK